MLNGLTNNALGGKDNKRIYTTDPDSTTFNGAELHQ
jgi:hypothetical protein